MDCKLIEIRDCMTFIPALAIEVSRHDGPKLGLLRRAGYRPDAYPQVILIRLADGKSHVDPYDWNDRTHQTAHVALTEHWEEYDDGAVVDVEFILGEKPEPSESECP